MAANNKLRAVVRHEYMTIIKQPSFWISLVIGPLIFAVIMVISILTDNTKNIDPSKETLNVSVIDNSGLIEPAVMNMYGLKPSKATDETRLKESVKRGNFDGLIVYPSNLRENGKYQLYSDNTDKDNSAVIEEIGRLSLEQSILTPLDDKLAALAVSGGNGQMVSYKNGEPAREFTDYLVPGVFLVLFYIVLIFSVSYALTSVSEEKENRSIEMVLSYVKPRTLILGKLVGIILVTLTQIAILALLAVAGYLIARVFGNELSLPVDLTQLSVVPFEILIGTGFLVIGFIFYVALMGMAGAIFPSSKEASGFSTIFFLLPAVPFWGIDAIMNQPTGVFSQFLSYFPLTSPTTVLLRNAAGNLGTVEGLLSLAVLAVATFFTILLTAKAFKLGTLEYSERIKFTTLFKR